MKIFILFILLISQTAFSGGNTGVHRNIESVEIPEIAVQPDAFRSLMREALTTSKVNIEGSTLDVKSTSMLEGRIDTLNPETLEAIRLRSN